MPGGLALGQLCGELLYGQLGRFVALRQAESLTDLIEDGSAGFVCGLFLTGHAVLSRFLAQVFNHLAQLLGIRGQAVGGVLSRRLGLFGLGVRLRLGCLGLFGLGFLCLSYGLGCLGLFGLGVLRGFERCGQRRGEFSGVEFVHEGIAFRRSV